MPKRFLCVLFILIITGSFLFALEGKIVETIGKVEVQKAGAWVPAKAGDVLDAGSVISTGFKSEAVLSIGKSTIKVKALTRLTIEQLYENNGNHASSVYLDVGSISADIKAAEDKRVGFTVKNPSATASVRGTEGDVFADGRLIGKSGVWAVSAPIARIYSVSGELISAALAAAEKAASSEGEVADAPGTASASAEPSATEDAAGETVAAADTSSSGDSSDVSVDGAVESYNWAFPSETGQVYVSAGEQISVGNNGTIDTPQSFMASMAVSSDSVVTLSESESVNSTESAKAAPAADSAVGIDVGSSGDSKPTKGTVYVRIKFPE